MVPGRVRARFRKGLRPSACLGIEWAERLGHAVAGGSWRPVALDARMCRRVRLHWVTDW